MASYATGHWHSEDYDEIVWEDAVHFRLIYQGRLPAAARDNARTADKHRIRKQIHPQLRQLWEQHPALDQFRQPEASFDVLTRKAGSGLPSIREQLGNAFARCGHHFVPLIGEWAYTVCGLDILFLRREGPGQLVGDGGDLDNRIKTLFDALRIPNDCGGVTEPEEGENPFFVLLQDDKQITEFSLITDVLLTPLENDQSRNDVLLIIDVAVKQTKLIGFSPFPLA